MVIDNRTPISRLRESGNVFLALFGAVAIVGVIGGTAAGIMQGPMKTMSNVSSRAMAESEIMSNTKMGIMAVSQSAYTKDCDNDGAVEAYPYNSSAVGKTGGVPSGGGYLPSEVETTRWTDPWGNSYTYCVWDHGTLVDDATCGGAGQNRLPGLNTTTYPTGSVNAQTFVAVLSAGPNRRYETTCQDWATADGNNDGDLDDAGDTPLANKPVGSDDIVMTYTYAEAAMATSSNWRIQSTTIDTAEIAEDEVEIGGQTASGDGVSTTISGSVTTAGLKLATDPGDDSISGACNAANDQAIRINTGGATKALEICTGGIWTPISGSSTSDPGCEITAPVIADGGSAWMVDNTRLNNPGQFVISGNYAFVAVETADSLTVIDISNPVNPFVANSGNAWVQDSVKLNGAHGVAISGNYAFVVSRDGNSLTTVDISDPLNPVIANSGNAWVQDNVKLDGIHGIEISGNYAYVTSKDNNSFAVIDISDPLNPVIANGGNAWLQDHTRLDSARHLKISGNYAYVLSESGDSFTTVDISDPLNPVVANGGNAWFQDNLLMNRPHYVDVVGNYAVFTVFDYRAIVVADISDPLNPVIANNGNAWVRETNKISSAYDINIVGRYAYTTGRTGNRFTVTDLGCDPEGYTGPTGFDIGFDHDKANCLIGNDGPPVLEATFAPYSGRFANLWHDGRYLYANNGTTVKAFSFNGSEITELAEFTFTAPVGYSHALWGDGTYLYANNGRTQVALSFNGTTFTELGTANYGSQLYYYWCDGEYFYSANNLSSPKAHTFDGSNFSVIDTTTSYAGDIWGDGKYIYTAHYGDGIKAHYFDGVNYTEIAKIDIPGRSTSSVYADGDYIYATGANGTLDAYSFDGQQFTIIASIPINNFGGYAVVGDGRYIYLAGSGYSRDVVLTFDGSKFNIVYNNTLVPGTVSSKPFSDGTYLYWASSTGIYVYSGLECYVAGNTTPSHALEYDYASEQSFESPTSATGSAESYGTAILLKSEQFGDEAGFSVNVSSAPTGNNTAMADW